MVVRIKNLQLIEKQDCRRSPMSDGHQLFSQVRMNESPNHSFVHLICLNTPETILKPNYLHLMRITQVHNQCQPKTTNVSDALSISFICVHRHTKLTTHCLRHRNCVSHIVSLKINVTYVQVLHLCVFSYFTDTNTSTALLQCHIS